ncbi:flagellar basal-body MS-ring/collar protein FliF [Sphingomonas sp. DT-204]|uniref:flagellar basal-body MS-ring/collar protein FliF n=1 Tax=Sphingomonas sp. DT-204 TaxID=3396166 RepID=UPI003F1B1A58
MRIVAAVFAVVFLALVVGYWFLLRADYAPAFTRLRPADASAVVAELKEKGIPYRLQDGGTTVSVPVGEVDPALVAIAGSQARLKGGVGFELFNKSDMGLTDFAQRINYQRALQGELERTIMMLDGVDSARVHLAMPERSLFRSDRSGAKAAVELVGKNGHRFDEARVAGIQRLVASSVPDLAPGDVVVLDADGSLLSTASTPSVFLTPEAEERQAISSYYRSRVRAALAQALPGLQVQVHVLVDADIAAPSGAAANDAGGAAAPAGTPAAVEAVRSPSARTFGLRITVATPAPLNAEDRTRAQSALAAAVGYDERLGDSISFEVGVAYRDDGPMPGSRARPSAAPAIAETASAAAGSFSPWLYGMFAAAALLAVAVVLLVRRASTPALSDAERSEVVARLKAALRDREATRAF